jgi:hypothetical protein
LRFRVTAAAVDERSEAAAVDVSDLLLAMQKVEGSNPFSRFSEARS